MKSCHENALLVRWRLGRHTVPKVEEGYLPADGLQEGSHNVGPVGVGSQAHNDPPGIPLPVGGKQAPKSWHKVHTCAHRSLTGDSSSGTCMQTLTHMVAA